MLKIAVITSQNIEVVKEFDNNISCTNTCSTYSQNKDDSKLDSVVFFWTLLISILQIWIAKLPPYEIPNFVPPQK
jgi:hypothetical protein